MQWNGSQPYFAIPEVTAMIFAFCIPPLVVEPESVANVIWPSARAAPLNISHVCRYWRSIALGLPELWTTAAPSYRRSHIVDALNLWLDRAGTRPMEISFTQVLAMDLACASPGRALLRRSLQRAEYISVQVTGLHALAPLFSLFAAGSPCLRAAQIVVPNRALGACEWYDHEERDEIHEIHLMLSMLRLPTVLDVSHLPRLSDLKFLMPPSVDALTTAPEVCMDGLKQLHLSQATPSADLRRWATQCPNLVTASFNIKAFGKMAYEEHYVFEGAPVTLISLDNLALTFGPLPIEPPFSILEQLHTPELRNLRIELSDWWSDPAAPNLAENMECLRTFVRGMPRLRNLTVLGVLSSAADFAALLRAVPRLDCLHTDGSVFSDALLTLLAAGWVKNGSRAGPAEYLACMRVLVLVGYAPASVDALVAFVRARPLLERVELEYKSRRDKPADIDALKEHAGLRSRVKAGLEVRIVCSWE